MNKGFSLKYGDKLFKSEEQPYQITAIGRQYELDKGVTVTMVIREYPEYNAAEWVLYFENTSGKDSEILSDICDSDVCLELEEAPWPRGGYMPDKGNLCVTTMNGMVDISYYRLDDKVSSTEYNLHDVYLNPRVGTYSFQNSGGLSSAGMMPFFDVHAAGGGAMIAIGWTGSWRTEFSRHENGVRVKTGLQKTSFYLKDGEKLRTSSILIMEYTSNEDSSNKFRKLIKNHFSHTACTEAVREGILAYELWGGLTTAEMTKRLKELKEHGIAFEDVWIDAGWYGKCTNCEEAFTGDWAVCTGDWKINKRVHPDDFAKVREYAESAGMNIMLWIEPERCMDGLPLTVEHPDWYLHKTNTNGQIADTDLLYYGNNEAKEYVKNMVSGYIEALNMKCYRQDFNMEPDTYFSQNDDKDRIGIHEIKHITGMYEVWDYLLEKHPGLVIDNCASGGRRIDLETLKRSIPFFRSDYQCEFNANPDVVQTHNSNISKYLPYNGCTTKTKADTYAVRSSYSSSWGGAFYNTVFQSMDEEDFAWARERIDEYREIRQYFSENFYNHGTQVYDNTAWTIWQYHDDVTQSGIVIAFRRCESPSGQAEITLKGTKANGCFVYTNLDEKITFEGTADLVITLREKRSSVILKYSQKAE